MSDEIPPKVRPDQYDKLLRRIWELEQRMAGYEKASSYAVHFDKMFDEQRLLKRMIIKIGVRLFKDAVQHNTKVSRSAANTSGADDPPE